MSSHSAAARVRSTAPSRSAQRVDVPAPVVGGAEARVVRQLRAVDRVAQRRELRVVPGADHEQPAVAGLEGLERRDVRMARAEPARLVAGHQVGGEGVLEDRELAVEHGDVDHACRRRSAPRRASAAAMPMARKSPAAMSPIETPTRAGGPSG